MEMSLASTAELRSLGMELSDPIPKFWNFFKKRMSDKFSQAILDISEDMQEDGAVTIGCMARMHHSDFALLLHWSGQQKRLHKSRLREGAVNVCVCECV